VGAVPTQWIRGHGLAATIVTGKLLKPALKLNVRMKRRRRKLLRGWTLVSEGKSLEAMVPLR
jgi:hypothetical protein